MEQYGIVKHWNKHLSLIVILHYRRLYYNVLQVVNIIFLS